MNRSGNATRRIAALVAVALALGAGGPAPRAGDSGRVGIAIHGGAGTIPRGSLTPEREREFREKLAEALMAGHRILEQGGSSLDAVERAITILEDSPLFNAGKGAVFTHEGTNELDAAIMDGGTRKAGAVAGVTRVRNPIVLARRVMERTKHVLLTGAGAEAFAREQGVTLVHPRYFFTQRRYDALKKAIADEKRARDSLESGSRKRGMLPATEEKLGTAGCVALDRHGHLAAGTSTGGTTNKRFGRVGDTPIIGAGTYADDRTCAVSATGTGEYFIRAVAAHSVSAFMEFRRLPVQQAVDSVIARIGAMGGDGGLIAIGRDGGLGMAFNTEGMYRAHVDADGRPVVRIYRAE